MAERALAYATALAGAASAPLEVLALTPDAGYPDRTSDGRASSVAGTSVQFIAADRGGVSGDVANAMLCAIQLRRAALVVMAAESWTSHGRDATLAQRVVEETSAPTVVVPTGAAPFPSDRAGCRILVALDGSDLAEQALRPACAVADALGGELFVLRVVTPRAAALDGTHQSGEVNLASARRYVEALALTLSAPARRVTAFAVAGDAPTMIAAVSRTQRASIIAMTTRGRGGRASSELGGVAGRSLHSTGTPILLVPPTSSAPPGGSPPSSALAT
ncbi:MAG: universal stress protein [Chloroflexi bacterium]|nr:universal stress protein [Chloroflexota bacterium]